MADAERVRIELGFRGGQSLTINVTVASADALDAALEAGAPDAVSLDAEDGRYTVVVKMVAFVKRSLRTSRVGFGAGA